MLVAPTPDPTAAHTHFHSTSYPQLSPNRPLELEVFSGAAGDGIVFETSCGAAALLLCPSEEEEEEEEEEGEQQQQQEREEEREK